MKARPPEAIAKAHRRAAKVRQTVGEENDDLVREDERRLRAAERSRKAEKSKRLDEVVETGTLTAMTCGIELTTARLTYEEFVFRAVRYASRREHVTIRGVREPAKLRREIRKAAREIGVEIRTIDHGESLRQIVPARLVEESIAERGNEIGIYAKISGYARPWHVLLEYDYLLEAYLRLPLRGRVAIARELVAGGAAVAEEMNRECRRRRRRTDEDSWGAMWTLEVRLKRFKETRRKTKTVARAYREAGKLGGRPPVWDKQKALAAGRRWVEEHGAPPRSRDHDSVGDVLPSRPVLNRLFGGVASYRRELVDERT